MPGGYAALLLLSGAVLGPGGLNVLGEGALALADPAVPVALAALGLLVALTIGGDGEYRAVIAANLQALATGVVVAGAAAVAIPVLPIPGGIAPWLPPAIIGICAATSASLASTDGEPVSTDAGRLRDFDGIAPIVVGAMLLAAARDGAPAAAAVLLLQACGVAVLIAAVGWLLLSQTRSDTEQRVFGLAILLLLGGAADAMALSALLVGFIAGVVWRLAGGSASEYARRDLARVQHPLVALVLIVGGARVEWSATLVAIAAVYVVLRACGKLVAGPLLARAAGAANTASLRVALVEPGVLGIAFALNALRAVGPEMAIVVSLVVVGSLGSHLLANTASKAAA